MPLITPTLISCDEAGFTGNHLLDETQKVFAYASHDLSLDESEALLCEARSRFPVQMPELKAHKLLRTGRGRALLDFITAEVDGRYIVTIYNKQLALCSKLFEYIYEPVLQRNNKLFYDNNFHRFVANFLYVNLVASPASMGVLAAEFEAFLRSLDPVDAPTLLGSSATDGDEGPLEMIRRFARGYNVTIARETRALRTVGDQGRWVLDLTTTAVFSHLVSWGQKHPLLEVVCDDSKPLMALGETFDVMINRHDHPTLKMWGQARRMSWNMSGPVRLASSAGHAGLQVADLLAGCAAAAPSAHEGSDLAVLFARMGMHLHEDCIVPDRAALDLGREEAMLNFFLLEHLAWRADEGADPLEGMAETLAYARETLPQFRAGDFARA